MNVASSAWCRGYRHATRPFVLALNASFEARQDEIWILRRMFHAMDIRRAVLEADAIRGIYLYNEMILAGRNVGRDVHIKPVTTFCV